MTRQGSEVGGPLSRVATVVYWYVVLGVLLAVTTAPGSLASLFLVREASNIPLYAIAALPLAPAVAAALFAWRVFDAERDQSPAHHFWRGYRLGWRDALRTWVLALVALVVIGTNLAHREAVGLSAPVTLLNVLLGLGVLLWAVRTLVITSVFSFRWRDAARLSLHTLVARPLATLGLVSLLVLTAGIALLTFDAVVVLLSSVLTSFLLRNETPVLTDVSERFVEH